MLFRCELYKRIIEKKDLEWAKQKFMCDFKHELNMCNGCNGPKEVSIDELIENASENIIYEDAECTTTQSDNVAICPYCGTEINEYDLDELDLENIGDTAEFECPVCEKDIEVSLCNISYTYSAVKTD